MAYKKRKKKKKGTCNSIIDMFGNGSSNIKVDITTKNY